MYHGTSNKLKEVNNFEKKLLKRGKVLTLEPRGDVVNDFFLQRGHSIEHLKLDSYSETEIYETKSKENIVKLARGLKDRERFIGIWAIDNLLHLDRLDLYCVLNKFYEVLIERGLLYLSFRFGENDYFKDGEWHTCFTEKELVDLVAFTEFNILDIENKEEYINVILKK
ncbi:MULTISPECIES: hypothetical protein [Cetobacterium]|uniref:Methyltransferase type 11 domain-containing protein n=1 Tax=Candidatus Cetobacterium colombiensis TaxID=3073100 RepID=A0ABU4WA83_9FUSO|nr:hypothetical protein [Candidatus Cetobacterium colombiensis]MDX8336050.1 hypothetical protein [Candidatus Cetobacterium colombiensis]